MKREYDFSNAVRGKFYRKGAELRLPIYLDSAMHRRLERVAKRRGKPVGDLVNQLLKKDLASMETRRRLHGRGAA
jgi:cytidylate kinase